MTTRPDLRLQLVSHPRYLCAVREMIATVSRQLTFNEAQCCQIALAVDEALANVMKHGYEGKADGQIWLEVFPLGDTGKGPGVKVVIEDEARQVDPATIKSRDLADIRPGGLGVHIIREVMDETRYEKRDGTGMRLTMIKHRNSPAKPCDGSCTA